MPTLLLARLRSAIPHASLALASSGWLPLFGWKTPLISGTPFSLFRVLAACFSQGPWDAFFFSRPPAPLVLVSCAFACSGVGPVVGYSLSRGETVGPLAGLGFYAPNRRAHRPFRPFQAPCFSPLSGTHASLSCSLLKGGTSTLCVDPSLHWAPERR